MCLTLAVKMHELKVQSGECSIGMRIFPGQLIAVIAVALIVGNGQCVASCSFEMCKGAPGSHPTRQKNTPPCSGHRNAPGKQSLDFCSAVVIAAVGQSSISNFSATFGD